MQTRTLLTILSIVPAVISIYLSCFNFTTITVSGFGPALPVPLGALTMATYCLGLATAGCLWATRKQRQIAGEKKKIEWAHQDAKLMSEVASDQVKQLEAKIATLEVALKSALKKKES
jgi:hypothetical protein